MVNYNHMLLFHGYGVDGDMKTERFSGHDFDHHWTGNMWFPNPIRDQPYIYFAWSRRYGASNILGPRPWPFGVKWQWCHV